MSSAYKYSDPHLANDYILKMQKRRYEMFKSQDVENGRFDVSFEIEGRKLHAHTFILTSTSETFNSWLSDRWTKKDEIIKVESYSYDSFYQFLSFVYSGDCELTVDNVREIVDMSEFYGVQHLKELCDKFLSNAKIITVENIEEMYDFCEKYSLSEFYDVVAFFIDKNTVDVLQSGNFINFKEEFVEFLFAQMRNYREIYFESVYKWAENQVKQNVVDNENFNLFEAVKAKTNTIVSNYEFEFMKFDFLTKFVLEKGFTLSPAELCRFYKNCREDEGTRFRQVYKLAEKQVLQKQKMAPSENFNLANSIKIYLAYTISHVKFFKMEKEFLSDFIAANGILTEEQINNMTTRIEIKNGEKLFTGVFIDSHHIWRTFEEAEYNRNQIRLGTKNKLRFINVRIPIPSTPSVLRENTDVQWYLCLETDHVLTLKHQSRLEQSDYLLAEMTSHDHLDIISAQHSTNITFSNNI
uniref:BTB domain-containing protein n=1 Tax=Panagrolaimus sp. PS1159 TaxID=55785 RepID=A0AC35EZE7_9BILA